MALLQTPLCCAHQGWRALTSSIRMLTLVLLGLHVGGAVDFDVGTASVWRWIREQSWSQGAMLEAVVAAVSFFSWISWFRFLHNVPSLRRFRFTPRPPAPSIFLDIWASLRGGLFRGALTTEQRRVRRELASFPVYLLAIASMHALRAPRPLEEEPPSFSRLAGEVALGIWSYDFIFYWIHLFMHRWPQLPHGHMVHHEHSGGHGEGKSPFLEPEHVVNHSLADGALQVAVNILVQNLPLLGVQKHKLSRLVHNVVVTYLLTEAHAGLDLPWASHRLFPEVFGGALRHEVHHRLHKCCFHQFFKYLDDMLGYGPPVEATAFSK